MAACILDLQPRDQSRREFPNFHRCREVAGRRGCLHCCQRSDRTLLHSRHAGLGPRARMFPGVRARIVLAARACLRHLYHLRSSLRSSVGETRGIWRHWADLAPSCCDVRFLAPRLRTIYSHGISSPAGVSSLFRTQYLSLDGVHLFGRVLHNWLSSLGPHGVWYAPAHEKRESELMGLKN